MCDQKCQHMHDVKNPRSDSLLSSLGCENGCDRILINSKGKAAVWQNKRTGLFKFLGENNGRPVYQNNATKEFLFFTFTGSEWLVGPDFRKPHAGIQVLKTREFPFTEYNSTFEWLIRFMATRTQCAQNGLGEITFLDFTSILRNLLQEDRESGPRMTHSNSSKVLKVR